ncbi:MAG: monophosphatase [Patescibacteria group bacterium]|nr:monophosphatase [Patescibacteria group bacterium]
MSQIYQGRVNGHIIGVVLKEAVRRALAAIRRQMISFEVTQKDGYSGKTMDDVFTTADTEAQEIYLRMLRECFPHCGVVAEEDSLSIEGSDGCTAYFTVDPLDGTKAFVRGQVHGVGTMVALVDNGTVVAAFIGDLHSRVVYGYRPGSDKVHMITDLDVVRELEFKNPFVPGKSYVLLRDPPYKYSTATQVMLDFGTFGNYQIDGGSIGVWMARLWRREVQAVILAPSAETPWDSSPVVGISGKLGYRFLKPNIVGNGWLEFQPGLSRTVYPRSHDTMIIHENDLPQLGIGW